jgi:protein-S-isoprenylcysteine O-methyltransferase Ste14
MDPLLPPGFLLAYFAAFFLLGILWRSLLVWRRTGINPFVLPSTDDAYGYVARAFKLVMGACAAVAALPVLSTRAPDWLGAWPALSSVPGAACGWLLLLAALAWLLVAQVQMGASWRIGIDSARPTALVRHGLFARSRNPIFLAMRAELLGLFLVLPGAVTLAVLVAGEILMQVQVRLEERHLAALHGTDYADYCARVPRWL